MIGTIKRLHDLLIGNGDTPLQARIFHEVSVIALIGLPLAMLVNVFIKIPMASVTMFSAWTIIGLMYINSRYYGRLKSSLIFFSIGTSVFMIFNYFINSGIQGPTVVLFLLSLVFTLSVMPTRQFLYWILINIVIVWTLLLIEYYNSAIVGNTYANRRDLFLDTATTYICVVACIGVVLAYLINSYEREKKNTIHASQALKVANDSKTRLLSILSHDLRSPLSSISSYLEMLREYEFSSEERQFIEKNLLNETKNMQIMLHNLLGWTKSQMDGGTSVNFLKLNLAKVVDDSLLFQRSAADIKTVSIHTRVDPSIDLSADLDMLRLVIQNLVNNAIKFTPSGGEIQIYSSHGPGSIQLHIADNGIGIPKERHANLFTFHAASTYGTENEKGVGLGLILCKEYTELQNGKISFSSQPGKGTEFTLEFPC